MEKTGSSVVVAPLACPDPSHFCMGPYASSNGRRWIRTSFVFFGALPMAFEGARFLVAVVLWWVPGFHGCGVSFLLVCVWLCLWGRRLCGFEALLGWGGEVLAEQRRRRGSGLF